MVDINHIEKIGILEDKMSDTEKSMTIMTVGVENINKNLSTLVASNQELSTAMIKHWSTQGQILKDIADDKLRIRKIEDIQIDGCSAMKNAVKFREFETDAMKESIRGLLVAAKKGREENDFNNKQIGIIIEKTNISNNRMEKIEGNQSKGMWAIIVAFIGIVVTAIKGLIS